MQKHILLLFFIVSSFLAYAMERESSSFFSSLFVVNQAVLSPMQEVQKGKDNFERQLQISIWSLKHWSPITAGLFSQRSIKVNPVEFLKYCYHQDRHQENDGGFFIDLSDFDQDVSLLNACKEAKVEGYSVLGAAIIGKEGSMVVNKSIVTSVKPHLIVRLINKGFTLKEKDKTLVALKLYNIIVAEQKEKILIALLNNKLDGDFSVLPYDVRRCMVDHVLCLYKKNEWLCSFL